MSDERISEERLVEIIRHSNCDEEECWSELAKKPEVPLMARELLALRASHAELMSQLQSIFQQVTNGRVCYFGDQTGYVTQFTSAQTERWKAALESARKVGE